MTDQTPTNVTGSCLCGSVKYTVAGGFGFGVNLTVDDPEKKIKVYKAGTSNSGNSPARSFCGACGSSLFVVSDKDPGRIAVTSGTMDDVQGVEGEGVELWKPKLEFFCIRKAKWLTTVGTAQKDMM
ncbi:glutathione-dependent formaldehyde-activating enzyme [Colletotrichum salicis]|uniref:Glutathione-dependent formaldehyde-activating enzyme n=1 Tax=Colletotrichum salicis TaxID=1209931 RepID=A0A135V751_9PEZI|nr:glutathione-dependent formaldehyde-activating enzyme [Colletotrichum salicis]